MDVELKKNTEQVTTIKQQDVQKQTVESFLQNTISDSDTQKKLIPIFIDIKKNIPENNILDFLSANSLNPLLRKTKILSQEETKGFFENEIIKDIQARGGSISVINQDSKISQENSTISQEALDKRLLDQKREETAKEYEKLDARFKPTADQLAEWKVKPENQQLIADIEKKFSGDEEKINSFLQFSYTATTFREAPETAAFRKNYDELKKLVRIPESQSQKRIANTYIDKALDENHDLSSYAADEEKPVFKEISHFSYFKEVKTDDKEVEKLLSFADEKIQNTLAAQKKILLESGMVDKNMQPQGNITKEMQKNLESYYALRSSALRDVQNTLQADSQNIMRQRTLMSPIEGLSRYFDSVIIDDKIFSDQFPLDDPRKSFSIHDDVLHMQGKVGDAAVGFYYNLKDPDVQLKADDAMHFDPVNKVFTLGINQGGMSDMGIRMPDLAFLSDKAKTFVDNNIQNILAQSKTAEDFQIRLKNDLSEHLLSFYGKPEIVKNRVTKHVEKNLAAQDIMKNYFPKDITRKEITHEENPEAHELLEIWDTALEQNSAQDIASLRHLQKRLKDVLDHNLDEKNTKLESGWKTLLGDMKHELGSEKTDQHRGTHLLSFLKKFVSEEKVLNLDDMEVFLTSLEKGESVNENLSKFSPHFQMLDDQMNADHLLADI